jgi:putative glutamine amidotransferase
MMRVNSFHHQAIKTVGDGLYASAVSPDGIVEAVEVPGKRFAIGVQWHPERMHDDENAARLFRKFIDECRFISCR